MRNQPSDYTIKDPEFYASMIDTAYRIMDYIDRLKSIEEDQSSEPDRIDAAAKERGYQEEDLEKLKALMRESETGFVRVIYYKYIEGLTLEEVSMKLNISYSYLNKRHAEFSSYLKKPKEKTEPKPRINPEESKAYLKALGNLISPEYETCCEHCGCLTKISHQVARNIFATESKRERVARKGGK